MSDGVVVLCLQESIHYQTDDGQHERWTNGEYPAACRWITTAPTALGALKTNHYLTKGCLFQAYPTNKKQKRRNASGHHEGPQVCAIILSDQCYGYGTDQMQKGSERYRNIGQRDQSDEE